MSEPRGYDIEYTCRNKHADGWSSGYRHNYRMFVLTTSIERALEFFHESFPPEAEAIASQVVLRTAKDARIDPELLGGSS